MNMNGITRGETGHNASDDSGPGPELMGANTLLGNDVYNKAGEDLGDIKEFMVDMASGKVSYAVLSFGGLLGMGDKLFAVPWTELVLDTANKRFTLDVAKATLEDAPGFDADHWPAQSDPNWVGGPERLLGTQHRAG